MSHRLPCPNGHVLVIPPKLEGKRIKCPKCQALMEVPIMTAAVEEEEIITEAAEEETPMPPPLPKAGIRKSAPPPPRRQVEEEDDEPPRRRRWRDEEDDDDKPHSRRRRRDEEDDDDWDDEPRSRRGREDDDDSPSPKQKRKLYSRQMRATRLGLLFFYINYYIYAGTILAFIVALVANSLSNDLRGLTLFGLGLAAFASLLVAPILGIIGASYIVRVPPSTHARGLGIAILVVEILPLACGFFGMMSVFVSSAGRAGMAGFFMAVPLAIVFPLLVNSVLLLLFLRVLSNHLGDKSTGQEAITQMISFLLIFIGGSIVVVASAPFLISPSLKAGHGATFNDYVWGGIFFIWISLMKWQMLKIMHVIGTVRGRI